MPEIELCPLSQRDPTDTKTSTWWSSVNGTEPRNVLPMSSASPIPYRKKGREGLNLYKPPKYLGRNFSNPSGETFGDLEER
jgi:hypothetical protein